MPPFGHLHHHRPPNRRIRKRNDRREVPGRVGRVKRVGRSRSGPAAPCEPVDEGRAVLACTAAIGKRGVTRTQMSHFPPSSRPSSERLARNLMGQLEGSAPEGETSALVPHSTKKRRGLRRWCTITFCGKITGDGVERMHLQEIVNRIDQRLESLGIDALEAERRAGRRDAIRNMRRAVARGKGGVTMRTIDALAPALSTTSEWLLTGQDKIEADETTEIILLDKRSPLNDDRVIEAFGLAFQSLVGKLITEVEASILARSVVRIIRLPEAAMTQAERRDMIRASVRLFRH